MKHPCDPKHTYQLSLDFLSTRPTTTYMRSFAKVDKLYWLRSYMWCLHKFNCTSDIWSIQYI